MSDEHLPINPYGERSNNYKTEKELSPYLRYLVPFVPVVAMVTMYRVEPESFAALLVNEPPLIGPIPTGWVMLFMIVVLTVLSFIGMWWAKRIDSYSIRSLLIFAVIVLLQVPALFLITWGSATLQLSRGLPF